MIALRFNSSYRVDSAYGVLEVGKSFVCVTDLGFTRAQQGSDAPLHEEHLVNLRHRVLSTWSRVTQQTNDNSKIVSQETQSGGAALSSPSSALESWPSVRAPGEGNAQGQAAEPRLVGSWNHPLLLEV